MASLWSEKYRPLHLTEIQGHNKLRNMLESAAKNRCRGLPPIILYGPPGTGKTSIAHALALDTYPQISPILSSLYLNASDERSIEVVRERIFDFVRTRWPGIERKFVIFDEVETMTDQAQLSLRALLDADEDVVPKPLYIFLCNTLCRVHQSIRSRAVAFFCGHLSPAIIRRSISEVLKKETKTPSKENTPSDITLQILRGDLRQIYCKIQTGDNINDWELWINRLKKRKTRGTIMIWQDAVAKSPVSVLCRNIMLWLEMNGYFDNKTEIAHFVKSVFNVRDINSERSAAILAEAWDNSLAKIIKD
jgi:DNA polymerase III delta prime subunit